MISMNKKIVFGGFLFILLIIVFPLMQSLLFVSNSSGKIEIDKEIEAPYLKSSKEELILVFYGYVGCVKVCTPILHQLDELYDSTSFEAHKNSVGLYFINLMPQMESHQPEQFAKSFNSKFHGVYLSQQKLMNIDRELGVFFSKNLSTPDEIDHSDNLYLVQRQKDGTLVLKSIYTMHPLNRELLIKDIAELREEKE